MIIEEYAMKKEKSAFEPKIFDDKPPQDEKIQSPRPKKPNASESTTQKPQGGNFDHSPGSPFKSKR